MTNNLSVTEALRKLEHYCAYQERCHEEVIVKLRSLSVPQDVIDEILVHLIQHNFLNEERFARTFARGKHTIKKWGKSRIVNELKARGISQFNINAALKELPQEDYDITFHSLAERHWETITEKNVMKKRKKFCDFLLRKGYESDLIYNKMKQLETID
ncbi:MAG TPA: regulatory protein RecX [Flavobacterium sp.]|jgi:regulatory protein